MLRTIPAALAIVLLTGAAWAAPALTSAPDTSIVINIVDDATSETDAIQLDEGKQPYSPGSSMQKSAPAGSSDQGNQDMDESNKINQ